VRRSVDDGSALGQYNPLMTNTLQIRGGSVLPRLRFDSLVTILEEKSPLEATLCFAATYVVCELLSIPPLPLVAFAGAMYGVLRGAALVLCCGLLSAAISFAVGRCFRDQFLTWLKARPKFNETFQTLDTVISKGGTRALLLLRLVPTPLPCLNYLFGVTGVNPLSYLAATALGYTPGTVFTVYSGSAGRAVFTGGLKQPWYVYAGGAVVVGGIAKLTGDVVASTLKTLKEQQ
jgi:uncharacterized membrane protein YdjX (TVP38/TMEM64 family)